MILEDQVTNLELSKKLKELGVKQESLFYWASFRNESSPKEQWGNVYNVVFNEDELEESKERDFLRDFSYVSAFTVAEIGEIGKLQMKSHYSSQFQRWETQRFTTDDFEAIGDTEVNSRAKMLIYLYEKGLIKNS